VLGLPEGFERLDSLRETAENVPEVCLHVFLAVPGFFSGLNTGDLLGERDGQSYF